MRPEARFICNACGKRRAILRGGSEETMMAVVDEPHNPGGFWGGGGRGRWRSFDLLGRPSALDLGKTGNQPVRFRTLGFRRRERSSCNEDMQAQLEKLRTDAAECASSATCRLILRSENYSLGWRIT
jgi:hypothetical protein